MFPGYDETLISFLTLTKTRTAFQTFRSPLRYNVDPPEFLFGVDMNNNNVIDRFENDVYADYPYRQDRDGYNLWGVHLNEHIKLTVGRAAMDEISSKRKAQMDYAIATGTWEWPGVSARVFQYVRSVEDDIADDVIQWVDQMDLPKSLTRLLRKTHLCILAI